MLWVPMNAVSNTAHRASLKLLFAPLTDKPRNNSGFVGEVLPTTIPHQQEVLGAASGRIAPSPCLEGHLGAVNPPPKSFDGLVCGAQPNCQTLGDLADECLRLCVGNDDELASESFAAVVGALPRDAFEIEPIPPPIEMDGVLGNSDGRAMGNRLCQRNGRSSKEEENRSGHRGRAGTPNLLITDRTARQPEVDPYRRRGADAGEGSTHPAAICRKLVPSFLNPE